MRTIRKRLVIAALLGSWLVACSGVQLIETNRDFVNLMQQAETVKQLHEEGEIDDAALKLSLEGLQTAFAEAGRQAAAAAGKAESPQNKAAFLNAAVRHYIKSGALGDTRVPDLAEQGRGVCATEEMTDQKALPTTCAYFHIADTQAASNEWTRKAKVIERRAREARNSDPRAYLPPEQGRDLAAAFSGFIAELDALEKAGSNIDWGNVDETLRDFLDRQQDLILCNARTTRLLLQDVEKQGEGWERASVERRLKEEEEERRVVLAKRPVGFSQERCIGLRESGL